MEDTSSSGTGPPGDPLDTLRSRWAEVPGAKERRRFVRPGVAAAVVLPAAVAIAMTLWLPPLGGREPTQDGPDQTSLPSQVQGDGLPDAALPPEVVGADPQSERSPRAPAAPALPVPADCPAVRSSALAADVDDDGCPEALRYTDGVLDSGLWRWQVGRAGDQVAVGDWWCTGRRTLAVLRPADGSLFAFPGWADGTTDLTVAAAGTVSGATSLRAADRDGDGCHELAVERGDLPPELIVLPSPEPQADPGLGPDQQSQPSTEPEFGSHPEPEPRSAAEPWQPRSFPRDGGRHPAPGSAAETAPGSAAKPEPASAGELAP